MAIRKNITMSDETANWYETRSEQMGVSQSALMSIALSEYIKQDKAVSSMNDIMSHLQKLQLQVQEEKNIEEK